MISLYRIGRIDEFSDHGCKSEIFCKTFPFISLWFDNNGILFSPFFLQTVRPVFCCLFVYSWIYPCLSLTRIPSDVYCLYTSRNCVSDEQSTSMIKLIVSGDARLPKFSSIHSKAYILMIFSAILFASMVSRFLINWGSKESPRLRGVETVTTKWSLD